MTIIKMTKKNQVQQEASSNTNESCIYSYRIMLIILLFITNKISMLFENEYQFPHYVSNTPLLYINFYIINKL